MHVPMSLFHAWCLLCWGMSMIRRSLAFSMVPDSAVRMAQTSLWSSTETSQVEEIQVEERTQQSEATSSLQQALQATHERALDQFMANDAPSWMQDTNAFPFSCTECGKCCKTQGEVYLAPEDITLAAKIRDQTPWNFVQQYAASYLLSPSALRDQNRIPSSSDDPSLLKSLLEDQQVWIRLREGDEGACVFLEPETNHCQIYEARPTQCRTYPFWPNIMKAPEAWDNECRRADDDEIIEQDNDTTRTSITTTQQLPTWSAERGGCEGMRLLMTPEASSNSITTEDETNSVPLRDACRQLMEYTMTDRRFPYQAEEMDIPTSAMSQQ